MLRIHLISLIIFSVFIVYFCNDIFIIMFCLFLSLFAKYIALSYGLKKFIKSINFCNIGVEFFCGVCFIAISHILPGVYAFCLIIVSFIVLIVLKRKTFIQLLKFIKTI